MQNNTALHLGQDRYKHLRQVVRQAILKTQHLWQIQKKLFYLFDKQQNYIAIDLFFCLADCNNSCFIIFRYYTNRNISLYLPDH